MSYILRINHIAFRGDMSLMKRFVAFFSILILFSAQHYSTPVRASQPNPPAPKFAPISDEDMFKVAVKITNDDESSGGTGVILENSLFKSVILTNKHVCSGVEGGGVVHSPDRSKRRISGLKQDDKHDLCLVYVSSYLSGAEVGVDIASEDPRNGEAAVVAGHPALLPLIVTRGHFSDVMSIDIMDSMRECTEEDKKDPKNIFYCALYGKIPVMGKYEARVVSATIMGGSSGSPVFDKRGRLSGLVFAGMQGLSYAFIVPLAYIKDFLQREATSAAVIVKN